MNLEKLIRFYGMDVNDFEVSPFESVNMLHSRSLLEKNIEKLSFEMRLNLYEYDLVLLKNAAKMVEHISKVYDFTNSSEPANEWWWHLDKIVAKTLVVIMNVEHRQTP